MSRHSSWYLIIRAVWSFPFPRLCSSYWDVPPTEELHSEPRGRLLLRLCGRSRNRPCVSNGMMLKGPSEAACNYADSLAWFLWSVIKRSVPSLTNKASRCFSMCMQVLTQVKGDYSDDSCSTGRIRFLQNSYIHSNL